MQKGTDKEKTIKSQLTTDPDKKIKLNTFKKIISRLESKGLIGIWILVGIHYFPGLVFSTTGAIPSILNLFFDP